MGVKQWLSMEPSWRLIGHTTIQQTDGACWLEWTGRRLAPCRVVAGSGTGGASVKARIHAGMGEWMSPSQDPTVEEKSTVAGGEERPTPSFLHGHQS